MKYLLLAIFAGCFCLNALAGSADNAGDFAMPKQYSAETVGTEIGTVSKLKYYVDGDKIRMERILEDKQPVISIFRLDLKKFYFLVNGGVLELPYDLGQILQDQAVVAATGKFEFFSSEKVDGVDCTKYKLTAPDYHVFFLWINDAKQIPVQSASSDGSLIKWKNFQAGPQDAALFETPAGSTTQKYPPSSGQ